MATSEDKIQKHIDQHLGKPHSRCRKHPSADPYLNSVGMIACSACYPCENPLVEFYVQDGLLCDKSDGFYSEGVTGDSGASEVMVEILASRDPYSREIVDGRKVQNMPVDQNGNPLTYYEFRERGSRRSADSYQDFVLMSWLMLEAFPEHMPKQEPMRLGKVR